MEVESIVEKKCFQLLNRAISFKASDIHIVPSETHYEIYFRKFGKLIPIHSYADEIGARIISYMKFLSGLDIGEKRKPQSGSFQKTVEEHLYSFRISTLPSIYKSESVVIRLLLQNSTIPLHQLSINPDVSRNLLELIEHKQGLLLLTGATGSGKTTTLYSLIHYCTNELLRHVISLEDPVEQTQEKILQIQVNERAGVSYSTGLKAILRHTPDVIMIGEIRDRETAQIALEAALTGHLVVSTVHAKDSVNCLYRLHDLGLSLEELRQALVGIVGQTLVELNDIDERKAMFELLTDTNLQLAIHKMKQGVQFELPTEQTLEGQMKKLELNYYERS